MWSLVKISKGQQVSLILCALCVIDQWTCHDSATITTINPLERNDTIHLDGPTLSTSQGDLLGEFNTSTENVTQTTETTIVNLIDTVAPASDIETRSNANTNSKFTEDFEIKSEKQSDKPYSKAGPPKVLIALLVCGLVSAAILLAVYYWMNKQSWSPQSKRLDEEPDAQDQHDSTMFSVASEDQSDAHEKPKLNGEAQENGENQIAASEGAATGNGHQKKKAEEADTEL